MLSLGLNVIFFIMSETMLSLLNALASDFEVWFPE